MPEAFTEAILEVEGENAEWRRVTTYKDPQTGDAVESTVSTETVRAFFEELRTDERLLYPGELMEASLRVYLMPNIAIRPRDLIARWPNTAQEKVYKILSYLTYAAYIEVEVKEV